MDKDPFLRFVLKIRFKGSVVKTDPCLYPNKYSPGVLKNKTKVLYILNTDKICFIKIIIESNLRELWKRIRFLEIKGFAY